MWVSFQCFCNIYSPNNLGNTNVLTENMKTTAVFSRDGKYRYLLKKEWDEILPRAVIIMIQAGTANMVKMILQQLLCPPM